PVPLADGTVLAIDLLDVGWDVPAWRELLAHYPYGLRHDGDVASAVYRMAGTELPVVRADWFVAAASRPPLYERLLGLPERLAELQGRFAADEAQPLAATVRRFLADVGPEAAARELGLADPEALRAAIR